MRRLTSVALCLLLATPSLFGDELTVLVPQYFDIGAAPPEMIINRGRELQAIVTERNLPPSEMMHLYLSGLADEAFARRTAEREKMKTPEQLAAYQKEMREFFVTQLGGFPERTPLNPRVIAKEKRDGYRIEKVIFESQPRFFVTAVLYLPTTAPPYPGVLVPCGHSVNGKGSELYQRASILLAKNGIAALCYDPIGQGERSQLLDGKGKQRFGSTLEHTLVGVGSILVGRNTATYRVWDGMRALDYLAGRDEVDAKRLGCTGNSGGGTLTSYLMALDERIVCAAPSCYLTSLKRLIDTIEPQDAEQNIFGQIARGMDHADYVMLRAPRPTLICCATQDFFDIDGTWDTFRQAKRFYGRLGFPERVDLLETDATHGFSPPLRQGMARWMLRWLSQDDRPVTEPEFEIMTDAQIQCTERGQVLLMDGARSAFDLNAELEKQLAAERRRFWKDTAREEALAKVREIAGIRRLAELPEPKVARGGEVKREDYRIEKLVIQPEPGIQLPALLFAPPKPSGDAYLYLNGADKQVDAAPGGAIEKLARKGHVVLAVDLRGMGETRRTKSSKGWQANFGLDWKDYFLAYLLGKSYVGMRAEDTLACARYLAGYHPADKQDNKVHLIAIGEAGPPALHAAALEPQLFASVRIERSLVSWASVVRTTVTKNQLINTVHGALRHYDLPDLIATLPKEKLTVVIPQDAAGQLLEKEKR